MKSCKIIHINDGNPKELHNKARFFAEEFPFSEELINNLLSQGYEVKQIIPQIMPNTIEKGTFPFYNSGFLVYLEKED